MCLLVRYLAINVLLFRAFASAVMCLASRCLAMGIYVTLCIIYGSHLPANEYQRQHCVVPRTSSKFLTSCVAVQQLRRLVAGFPPWWEGGYSPASHHGGPGSSPGQVMWDLWLTKWYWGRCSPSTSVFPDNSHSTDCSTFVIIHHPRLVQ
jgi:hypothetical protein